MHEPEQFRLPAMPPAPPAPPPRVERCTWANYKAACKERYAGFLLRDALANWADFEERREDFTAWMNHYRRDPRLTIGAKEHNPTGSLKALVWVMQTALEPDTSCLFPCLDFADHHQAVFIRRGLLIYLELLEAAV